MQNIESKEFPNRPINFIVPFGPGGGTDMQARVLEKLIVQHLGQAVVIQNKPGGAGILGWGELAKSNPDGYTIGIASPEVLLHTLYNPGITHYLTSLDPLAQVMSTPSVLVVNSDQPWQNIHDIVGYAKQNPQAVKYGHSGIGSLNHLMGALLAKLTGTQLRQVPFQSGSEVIATLLGNHVEFAFVNPVVAKEHIKVGTLRPIATSGEKRLRDPQLSHVPTLKESGIDLVITNWLCVAAPKELPLPVKALLEKELKEIVVEPEFQEKMAKLGMEIEYLGNRDSQIKWVKEAEKLNEMLEGTGFIEEVREHRD